MNRIPIFKIVVLLIAGSLLGFAVNVLRGPERGRISWVGNWSETIEEKAQAQGMLLAAVEDVQSWSEQGSHIILDARPTEEFQAGHIPGAMSLPYHNLETAFPDIQLFLTPDQPIVSYCSGEKCEDSILLGTFLIQQGYTNIFLFEGGMTEWRERNLPEEQS